MQGYTHLGVEDISVIKSLEKNVEIFCPSTKSELIKSFNAMTKSNKLSYLRLWRNNEPELKYDKSNKYYSQKNQMCENLIISVGPVSGEVFKLDIKYCHINFYRINNIPDYIFKKIFNQKVIKKILFIEENIEYGSLYYDYLIKKSKLNLSTKKIYKNHFSFSRYKKHGSEIYLRKIFKMNKLEIEKTILKK